MLRLAFRNLVANPARLILITFAVAIGVSFVSATFIFSDSLSKTFDELTTEIAEAIDLEVRSADEFGTVSGLTSDIVDEVAAIDGVEAAAAYLDSEDVYPLNADGEPIGGINVAMPWIDHPVINLFGIVDGRAPEEGEFVLNAANAESEGFVIGETYQISSLIGVVERTLSGTIEIRGGVSFGDGLAYAMYPLEDAQTLSGARDKAINSIFVIVDDQTPASEVQQRLEAIVPAGAEVVNSRTLQEEQSADFNGQVAILRNVLLGFAIVSVFVSTFIIRNTFGIVLSQRIRELGLLRAIGADGRQIGRSVLLEGFVIGVVASLAGLLLGVGVAVGLVSAFRALGAPLPDLSVVFSLRTVLVALAVGVGATVLSSVSPARQARRLSPVAALAGQSEDSRTGRLRVLFGIAMIATGAIAGSLGLFAASGTAMVLTLLGGGIALMFIGITLASPILAPPIIAVLGAPVARLAGTSGSLARNNARRNPRRTANTAAALMIGLSLITTVLVVGQSVKSHLAETLDNTVSADFVVSNDFEPVAAQVAAEIAQIPELTDVMAVSETDVEVTTPTGTEIVEIQAMPIEKLGRLFDLRIESGELPADGTGAAVLPTESAADAGLTVGDELPVRFWNGETEIFTVVALYGDTTLIEAAALLDRATVEAHIPFDYVDWIAAKVAPGVTTAEATAAMDELVLDWPQVNVQTATDYRESIEAEIDQLLSIVNVLLALSIVIALIGIGLTLALSVFERTREIGLLRAVGMSRRQVRRMVRWEAALIGLFGAVLGVGTGLIYGWAASSALPESVTSSVAIPVGRLGQLVLASAIAALLAALLPARRAGRMNVLDAITGRRA